MGEVYRARDTRLGRDVALKCLPVTFTHDRERLARFEREAQILAALNHPRIGAIYSLDEAEGTRFLILELVVGESLDKRLARGPVPVDEALTIAAQIAEALQAAHDKGIIHRDLKPANIALTEDQQVKVLDFGLATTSGAAVRRTAEAATATGAHTHAGAILGTAAYMSPEQARGQAVDTRTDVWAFGCVLYELLTGRAAFGRGTTSEIIAAILEREPDWQALPAAVSPRVRRLLQSCLEKDRERRPSIATTRRQIDSLRGARRRSRLAAAAAAVLMLAGVAGLWLWNRNTRIRWAREEAVPEVMRLAEREAFPAAFALAEQAARVLPTDDPVLKELWPDLHRARC